ncbi:MFS transporter [Actinokineospora terrae]|uniref:Predicted arabinose efflux permease, MFS family n=1 Tax=Actinokineospora terrae TaxID=155974 RepID=A0A1H9MAJ9_9PSEU|nr:MFS transporter [Actinokineospora terrae]SER20163.1 Predicted arabinose efflux permease, MFS family [Actinokineospora terrae]
MTTVIDKPHAPPDTTTRSPRPLTPTRRGGAAGLALGTLAVGTSGHAVAGLLPIMSAELHTPIVLIGQLATVFALVCAVSAPVLAVATGRWERRRLLVACLTVTAAGNALAAAAPTYPVLLAGRVLTALGAAMTTAIAVGLAAATSTPARRARAMAIVLSGLTGALLIGVPGVAILAHATGYRPALWTVTALCAAAALVIAATAPRLPAPPAAGIRDRVAAATRPGVGGVLGGALLAWTSTGTVYPYLAVLLDGPTSAYLTAYGLGAATGTLTAGHLADRLGPRPVLITATATSLAALLLLPHCHHPAAAMTAVTVWGAAAWSTTPPLNARLDTLADRGTQPLLLALAGSVIYLGMGLGGLLGGAVITWAGPDRLPTTAALATAAALHLFATTGRHHRPRGGRPPRQPHEPFAPTPSWPLR